jgi:peptidoglycan/xylan/chitin deacetylase (PgdA/CDA1 family)
MWIWVAVGAGVAFLSHSAPAPLFIDFAFGGRSVWHMPADDPPTVYLTFDDGPNPTTTPDLLEVLEREQVPATFFLIDRNISDATAPLVQRIFAGGHSVALHSHTRKYMIMTPAALAETLEENARHIERVAGRRPCRAFRPHAGWRSVPMYLGLRKIDHRMVGFGWMLWDFNWFRTRTADSVVARVSERASAGDIIVMHDGDESFPVADQRHTVEATARLIPLLRAKGFSFGTVCANQ